MQSQTQTKDPREFHPDLKKSLAILDARCEGRMQEYVRRQNCRVGKVSKTLYGLPAAQVRSIFTANKPYRPIKPKNCTNGPCVPGGQRSRVEWCDTCDKIF
jgi:hypothetical protein